MALDRTALVGNDKQLTECERDALAQLVRRADAAQPPRFVATVLVDVEAERGLCFEVRPVQARHERALLVEPGGVAHVAQAGDPGRARSEACLGQEARRLRVGIRSFVAMIEAGVEDEIAGARGRCGKQCADDEHDMQAGGPHRYPRSLTAGVGCGDTSDTAPASM